VLVEITVVSVVLRFSQSASGAFGPLPYNFNFTSIRATFNIIAPYSHTMSSTPSEGCLCIAKIAIILAKIALDLIQINALHVARITFVVQS